MSERTGKVDFQYGGQTYQTWYKVVGDLNSGIRPAVVLHGGPGLSHHYVLPFADLHTYFGIPVVFYDQIGIGESSHPKNVSPEFWTLELFMDELDNLLEFLGVKQSFDLCGHSWGAMFAAHYASHRHPSGLKRLVLASGAPSAPLWVKGVRQLLGKLPDGLGEKLEKHEREGTIDDPEYQDGLKIFYAKHFCQLDPWPQELTTSHSATEADPTVYKTMVGPLEFSIIGSLKDWSCLERIHTITSTTLVTNGMDDVAQDVAVAPFFNKIPHVRWVTFTKSSHMTHFEERDRFFKLVGEFLTGTERLSSEP